MEADMIPYYQFEQCIDWLTDRDELTKELDQYKQAPTNWSRKRTRELCNNVAVLTAPFWANNGHDRATASIVFDMVAKVIYRYIHAEYPDIRLNHRKTIRDVHKLYGRRK